MVWIDAKNLWLKEIWIGPELRSSTEVNISAVVLGKASVACVWTIVETAIIGVCIFGVSVMVFLWCFLFSNVLSSMVLCSLPGYRIFE